MPTYDIQDASGKVILTLEGDTPPTDADIDEALSIQAQTPLQAEQTLMARAGQGEGLSQEVLDFRNRLAAEQAAIPSVEQRLATAAKPDLPQFRFTDLPGMNERTPLLGFGSPEEMRKQAIDDFAQLNIGDEYVHPVAGRIRKSGSFEYQVIDPNERSPEFFSNVKEAIKSGQRGAIKSAAALGAGLAGDRQTIEEITPQIQQDLGEVGRTLGATEKVAVPAALRMAGPTIGLATAPFTGPGAFPIAASLGGLGEVLAERYEGREKISPFEVGAAVLTGPIGGNNLRTGVGMGRALLTGAGEGALVGGANIGARKLEDISEGREVEFGGNDLAQLGLTTAFGGLARGAEKTVNKGMEVLNKTKEAPPMANVATQNAANIGSDTNALQASLNQVTTPSPAQQSAGVFEQALQQQDELAEVQKAIDTQVRRSEAGAAKLREQLALEQATAERAAIQQERQLADIQAEEAAFPELQENFPELSPQAQRMYDDYGRVTPGVLPMLASGAAGGVGGSAYGATQGETPEERMTNALRYGGIGLVGGPALTALGQAAYRGLTRPRARTFTGAMEPQMLDDIVPVEPGSLGEAPAVFRGVQEGLPARGVPDIELFNLTQEIPGHPAGSTVSRNTLEAAGYTVPDLRTPESKIASLSDEIVEPAPRPLPKDIEFLYRQNLPTREGGEKAVNYFQVDKTPENPRGLTVDDAVLMDRGYSQEQITKMADDLISGRGSPFIGGANAGAIINPLEAISSLSNRLRAPKKIAEQGPNPPVRMPETEPGQFVRKGVEKAIRNRDNPLEFRQSLAENPDIVGTSHSITDVVERMEQLDEAGLRSILASTDASDFDKLGAQATLFNRLNAEGRFEEAAPLMVEATKAMTPSAQIINYGKLFKNPEAYAEGINRELEEFGRTLSGKQYQEFTRLGQADIGAESRFLKANKAYGEAITKETAKELKEAEKALGSIKRQLAEKTAAIIPKRTASLLAQRVKLGLLSVPTVTVGFAGNAVNLGMKEATRPVVAGIDALRSAITGAPREVANAQTMEAWLSGARTFARNFKELFTGASDTSFALGRGSVGSTPFKDIVQAFGPAENFPVKIKDGVSYVPNRDRAMRLIRGLTGAVSLDAVLGRLISFSDNPFREVSRVNLLDEAANLRGLTGDAKKQFMANPPVDVLKRVEAEAADTVFAQQNPLTKYVDKAFKHVPKDLRAKARYEENAMKKMQLNMAADAVELATVSQVPFTTFPVNYVGKAFTLGVPGFALGQAVKSFAVGDIRRGEEFLRDAMVNAAGVYGALWLWEKGAVSAPPSTDPKRRAIDHAGLGAGKINLSQIQRALNGEWKEGEPTFRSGDVTRDIARLGPVAAPVLLTAKYLDKRDFSPPQEVGKEDGNVEALMSYLGGVPSFMLEQSPLTGARSFLQALADSDDEDKLKAWLNNTTRAVVSSVLPATLDKVANYNSYPQLLDMRPESANPLKMAKDIAAYKLQLIPKDSIVNRVTIWGKDIDVHKGVNPVYKQFIDPFRTEVVNMEPFEVAIRQAYVESGGNPDAYPGLPSTRVTLGGLTYDLDKEDAYTVAKERGRLYRKELKELVNNPKWQRLKPQAKVLVLNKIYSEVNAQHGAMVRQNPAFIEKYEDKVERKTTQRLAIEEAMNQ